jgi:transposase-like protein
MPGKVKTISQVCTEYNVHRNTLYLWIQPIKEKLKLVKGQRLLLPWQLKMIYDLLDEPGTIK